VLYILQCNEVFAGPEVSAFISEEGQLKMTGMGTMFQLAREVDADAVVPFNVNLGQFVGDPPVASVAQVACGGQHTLLLVV